MANVALNTLNFENVLTTGAFGVSGYVNMYELGQLPDGSYAPNLTNPNPANIQCDQDAIVRFEWTQSGILTQMLTGIWKCDVFFELMGPNEGPTIAPGTVNFLTGSNPHTYIVNVKLPAGSIAEGIYRVTARLMLSPIKGTFSPVCAFTDLGLCEYFNG